MKIGFKQVNINASFPCHQAGFASQTYDVDTYHDDLNARIVIIQDDNSTFIHISCDSLGLPLSLQSSLNEQFKEQFNNLHLVISCTHTHFACSPHNEEYIAYLKDILIKAIRETKLVEDNYQINYQCIPFEEVGKSRISFHQANVLLQLLTIAVDNKPELVFIIHNCHPTIMNGTTPFFSSEYPGYAISKLKMLYPKSNFTFIQGAAGDISTRFTRSKQDYDAVMELGNKLVYKVDELLHDVQYHPFTNIHYDEVILPLEHTFEDIDLSNIPANLSTREIETINIGANERKKLAKKLDKLPKQALINCISLQEYKIIFAPNELFSYYIQAINTNNTMLACYSNGYSPYVTGINDNFITYEMFTDTLTSATKEKLFNTLSFLSNK